MPKNQGHFQAFSKNWFTKHQAALLWLLNSKLTKRLFRYILRIHKDCPDKRIVQILPNSYTVLNKRTGDQVELTTDFRTHNKFAKRLYFAFRPVWWMMHFWDWAVLDRFELVKEFSFGFSTLTVYPQAGSGGTTCDGSVGVSGAVLSFTDIHSAVGNYNDLTNGEILLGCDASITANTNMFSGIKRGIMTFNTAALTASATITAAVLSIFPSSKDNTLGGTPTVHIAGATPAANNTLANSDYGNVQFTSFGNVTYANWLTSAYSDITLNTDGVNNISKTGISGFSAQLGWDILNNFTGVWAGYQYLSMHFSSADSSGTSHDPKLVVTYTITTPVVRRMFPGLIR